MDVDGSPALGSTALLWPSASDRRVLPTTAPPVRPAKSSSLRWFRAVSVLVAASRVGPSFDVCMVIPSLTSLSILYFALFADRESDCIAALLQSPHHFPLVTHPSGLPTPRRDPDQLELTSQVTGPVRSSAIMSRPAVRPPSEFLPGPAPTASHSLYVDNQRPNAALFECSDADNLLPRGQGLICLHGQTRCVTPSSVTVPISMTALSIQIATSEFCPVLPPSPQVTTHEQVRKPEGLTLAITLPASRCRLLLSWHQNHPVRLAPEPQAAVRPTVASLLSMLRYLLLFNPAKAVEGEPGGPRL
ncbi:hypothetical protein RhiJN_27469 [Ceratobasidium sp. AG-Ba]|nr:hypothetical protein RhiJN_27469 [Ceratobasidium sp. AG-Ba]